MIRRRLAILCLLPLAVAACQQNNQPKLVLSAKSPVELRAMQTRAFDTDDRNRALRVVVATLQDLGYGIDKVDTGSGTVSATKMATLRVTASAYPRSSNAAQTVVRANAIYVMPGQDTQVDSPAFYQQLFFEPLSKALFLTALQVEDEAGPDANSAAANSAAADNTPPVKRN